ncbi:uncharacterized protein LOC134163303 isoform X2 [Pezoporus occidentalis]|uniref:uncharacterized protein LOC134163303 isoform X2 n=1 Tax=Pezoporus occidentalis TaxID=407982 RepID=UPI002F9087BF
MPCISVAPFIYKYPKASHEEIKNLGFMDKLSVLGGQKLGSGSGCTLMAVISPARNSCLLPAAFLQTHHPGFDTTGPVTDSELVNFVWLLAHLCCSLQTTRSAWGKKNKIKNSHRIFHNPLLGLGHKAIPFRRSEIVFPYSYDTALISTQPAFPSIYLGGCCCFCCC